MRQISDKSNIPAQPPPLPEGRESAGPPKKPRSFSLGEPTRVSVSAIFPLS